METRVERYKKLREEILTESPKEMSKKEKSSERVGDILSHKDDDLISYDDIVTTYKLYDDGSSSGELQFVKTKKMNVPYLLLSFFVIGILIAILIVLAILIWR